MTPDRTKAARELLAFYLEAGADALLGEEPVDRFTGGEEAPARSRPLSMSLRETGDELPLVPRSPPQAGVSTRPT
jgi:hypothetical protein